MIQLSVLNVHKDITVRKGPNTSLTTRVLLVIIVARAQPFQQPVPKVLIMTNYTVHLLVTVRHVLWVMNVQRHKLIEELSARKDTIVLLVLIL